MADHIDTNVPGQYPPHTYLFIDDLHIARQEGVEAVLNSPEKVPEPVMKPEKPWEGYLNPSPMYRQKLGHFKVDSSAC